jgi:hypothetical protein
VPAGTEALVVQVIVGELTVTLLHAVEGSETTLEVCKLLKAKVVAEGEAVLFEDPGNVKIIFPPDGTLVCVVNFTVCKAVMGTIKAVPLLCALVALSVRYTVL